MKKFAQICIIIFTIIFMASPCSGAIITNVKESERFKTYKEEDELVKFLRDLVIWDEDTYSELAGRINWLIDRDEFSGDIKLIGDEKKLYWYNGDYYITWRAPGTLAANYEFTWPANDGDSGQVLRTDGSGVTIWSTSAGMGDMLKATYDTDADGLVELAAGGLEVDVSGYTDGLYGIASGVTADIDTEGEIETALGGINILLETEIDASSELIALMDDETGTGALVFADSPTLSAATIDDNDGGAAMTIRVDDPSLVCGGSSATRNYGLVVTTMYNLFTIDSAPTPADFIIDSTLTGATSGATVTVVTKISSTQYVVKDKTGSTFTDGEVISDGTNSRDCGAGYPAFTHCSDYWPLQIRVPDLTVGTESAVFSVDSSGKIYPSGGVANLVIGENVQAWDEVLDALVSLGYVMYGETLDDNEFLVGVANNELGYESGATARTSLGLGSIATQAANNVDIDGGAIDGATIGGTTPAAGTFTDLTATGNTTLGNASTDLITCTGRWIPRTVASDPTSNNTAGSLGEIVFFNDKWYGKTVADGTDQNWVALN